MKENPAMQKIYQNMKPGVISLHGFLGKDRRGLEEIIEHDRAEVERLGTSLEELADGLEKIRDKALEGMGDYVDLNDNYIVRADSIRGKLPCPFDHKGLYRKTVVSLKKKGSDEQLLFTDLGIHLIREHGFFQGKRNAFRIEPERLLGIIRQ